MTSTATSATAVNQHTLGKPDNKPDAETKKNPDFKDLSYSDVQINLRMIQDFDEGDHAMIIDGKCLQVDKRFFPSIRRSNMLLIGTNDSRDRTVDFIEHVIDWSKKYCDEAVKKIDKNEDRQSNFKKLINLQTLLSAAKTGMSKLATTYRDDKLITAKLETLRSTIERFCDDDLKIATHERQNNRY